MRGHRKCVRRSEFVCWRRPCHLLKNSLQGKDVFSRRLFLRAHPCMARKGGLWGRWVVVTGTGTRPRHRRSPLSQPPSRVSKYNYNDIAANARRKLARTSDQRDVWERRWTLSLPVNGKVFTLSYQELWLVTWPRPLVATFSHLQAAVAKRAPSLVFAHTFNV